MTTDHDGNGSVHFAGNDENGSASPSTSARIRSVKLSPRSATNGDHRKTSNGINRARKEYFYGGPIGALLLIIGVPIVVLTLNVLSQKENCTMFQIPKFPKELSDYFDLNVILVYAGWVIFQLSLYLMPVGTVVYGLPQSNGQCLQYRCNGFLAFTITFLVLLVMIYLGIPLEFVYDKLFAFHITSIIFAFSTATLLYFKSFYASESTLNDSANTGSSVYDFFVGRELNPRIGNVDIKTFFLLRLGVLGWLTMDLATLTKDYTLHGHVWTAELMCCFGQFVYIWDALFFDESLLTTRTITSEGFGFMYVYGSSTLVPFIFSMCPRIIMEQRINTNETVMILLFFFNVFGYTIYRLSNTEKEMFLRDPGHVDVAKFQSIPTEGSHRLLVDGWWSWSRHPNYYGDFLIGLAWCAYSGTEHALTYTYSVYQALLFIYRARQQDMISKERYGEAWSTYSGKVPHSIIKRIY